jgi:peptide chain release factor 2
VEEGVGCYNGTRQRSWYSCTKIFHGGPSVSPTEFLICGGLFDGEEKRAEISALEAQVARPDFWSDQAEAQKTLRHLAALKEPLARLEELVKRAEDLLVLVELADEADDNATRAEADADASDLEQELRKMELEVLLSGRYDNGNAILSLHAGAGGTESCDWVAMLHRMYTRWAERQKYKVEILDLLEGEEAGVKSITISVRGPYAYGFLRPEMGVHRLVRISPFDASGRRHTSFAACEVMPEIEDDSEIEIRPEDLRIDTFRAGGAGGQHVNKTESAVRITHIPTGVVVGCQNERSQLQNRATSMMMLRSKLAELKLEEQNKEMAQVRGPQMEIAWGSQIRSYVFQPYTMVKDHRTGVEIGNVQAVMDGEIMPFIYEFLKRRAAGELLK